jgi:hypothetical protein
MIASMCYYGSTGCKISRRSLATLTSSADTKSASNMAAFLCPRSTLRVGHRDAVRHGRSRCSGFANSVAHSFSMEQS